MMRNLKDFLTSSNAPSPLYPQERALWVLRVEICFFKTFWWNLRPVWPLKLGMEGSADRHHFKFLLKLENF